MAPNRAGLNFRVAGAICLLAGLFPYYSHTAGPAPAAGVPPIEIPGVGAFPDRPSNTLVRVGLPFSPLFVYHREDRFSSESQTAPAGGGTVTGKSGEFKLTGDGEVVTFNSSFSARWRFEVVSWSAAAVVLGIVLVACSFLVRRGRE